MRSVRTGWVLLVIAMTAVWFVIRYGYDFGVSDQDEFLPYVLHLGHPEWLASDWFVQSQRAAFSVRTSFAWILHGMTLSGLSIGQAVMVLYVLSWLLLGMGIFRLSQAVIGHPVASLASIPLVLLVTSRWNPGGNDFMYGMMVPESLAWGLVLVGASLLTSINKRPLSAAWASGLMFGMAVWIHPLVGLQTGAVALLVLLFARFSVSVSWKKIGWWSAVWLVCAVPVVWMLSPDPSPGGARAIEILVHLRSPHHYLPQSFAPASVMLLLILVSGATWVLWSKPDVFRTAFSRQAAALLCWVLVVGLAGAAVIVHMWPDGPLTVLQPFKLAVLLRGLSVVLISAGLVSVFDRQMPPLHHGYLIAMLLTVLGVAFIVWLPLVQQRALPFSTPDRKEFQRLAVSVRENTAEDAVLVIPPDWTGFQFASHRAQYVNFKAFPFRSREVLEWYDRLTTAGVPPARGDSGTEWLRALSAAYAGRTQEEWHSLLGRINATHAIVPESVKPHAPLFCQSGWCLVRAPSSPHP